jgi:hypothetical protein
MQQIMKREHPTQRDVSIDSNVFLSPLARRYVISSTSPALSVLSCTQGDLIAPITSSRDGTHACSPSKMVCMEPARARLRDFGGYPEAAISTSVEFRRGRHTRRAIFDGFLSCGLRYFLSACDVMAVTRLLWQSRDMTAAQSAKFCSRSTS